MKWIFKKYSVCLRGHVKSPENKTKRNACRICKNLQRNAAIKNENKEQREIRLAKKNTLRYAREKVESAQQKEIRFLRKAELRRKNDNKKEYREYIPRIRKHQSSLNRFQHKKLYRKSIEYKESKTYIAGKLKLPVELLSEDIYQIKLATLRIYRAIKNIKYPPFLELLTQKTGEDRGN
ncbi:MAG: hypothetical protein DRH26_00505 [Deltaproteobacteria bacterium]|nr:MAG: hypothetical protein DRH26_00505 [Deltaproteobacteria bacterium]